MLLARHGYRVLLVDRAKFPSDTISTHWIWPRGNACLKRWGLLDRVLATNCPPFRTMGLDLGDLQLIGDLPPIDGVAEVCVPRRTVLDKLLLDAAAEAGAEVREGFSVTGLTSSDGDGGYRPDKGVARRVLPIQPHALSPHTPDIGPDPDWEEFAVTRRWREMDSNHRSPGHL